MDIAKIIARIQLDEGFSSVSFWDYKQWTWGYGTKAPGPDAHIDETSARKQLVREICNAVNDYYNIFGFTEEINEVRQRALVNMIFNLGAQGVKDFKKMCAAIYRGDWEKAAEEAKDSKWFNQVGRRSRRIVEELRTGEEV
jgi:lysozyme